MAACLRLARKGEGYVSPNPIVGAVLVRDYKVIGQGFHRRFGGPHAEVHAIRSAKTSIRGSTLYINLEPCCFTGKTPPCTDLILTSGISRLVVGMKDPNPLVKGKGIEIIRSAGIKVTIGVLTNECGRLNESFTKYVSTSLPFITLKIAQTLDGKIADTRKRSKWITNSTSRQMVHHLRSKQDAVLVGSGTVLTDDPRLTVRVVRGRNPIRIVLDGRFGCDLRARVFGDARRTRTIIIAASRFVASDIKKKNELISRGVEIVEMSGKTNGKISLRRAMTKIASLGIASILVEGGASVFSSFLTEHLADKIMLFVSPKILGKGIDVFGNLAPRGIERAIQLENVSICDMDGDILIEAYLHK